MPLPPFTNPEPRPDLTQLPGHHGQPRPHPAIFFADPPQDLGPLISADSTLRPGGQFKSMLGRALIGIALAAILFFACDLIGAQGDPDERAMARRIGAILGLVTLAVQIYYLRVPTLCTYVGSLGISRFTIPRWGKPTPIEETLLFDRAASVHTRQTRQYTNGIYTGTSYDYTWHDLNGKRLYQITGSYRGGKKPPKPADLFHFANSAEIAWSNHFLTRIEPLLTAEGALSFAIDHHRSLLVGPGFIEFHFGGNPFRLFNADIASVSLANGQFSFKHKDAKWYSSVGKFSFPYAQMPNAKVFLMALSKFMGYHWQ